jgi:hypothetical protein
MNTYTKRMLSALALGSIVIILIVIYVFGQLRITPSSPTNDVSPTYINNMRQLNSASILQSIIDGSAAITPDNATSSPTSTPISEPNVDSVLNPSL